MDTKTDPRVAALAAALHAYRCGGKDHISHAWESPYRAITVAAPDGIDEQEAEELLAALPADWCGHDWAVVLSAESIVAHNKETMAELSRLRAIEEAAREVAETWDAPVYVGQADHYGATAEAIDALRGALAKEGADG